MPEMPDQEDIEDEFDKDDDGPEWDYDWEVGEYDD